MTNRNDLEGRAGYREEHQEDDRTLYEKIKQGAENFLNELRGVNPRLQDSIITAHTKPRLDDDEVREHRSRWQQHNQDDTPGWMERDTTNAANSITESFAKSMTDLQPNEAKQAGYNLAQVLTMPAEEQLDAARNDHRLQEALEPHKENDDQKIEHIKDTMALGLAYQDPDTVKNAMDNLSYFQVRMEQLDDAMDLLEQHRMEQYGHGVNADPSIIDRIKDIARSLWERTPYHHEGYPGNSPPAAVYRSDHESGNLESFNLNGNYTDEQDHFQLHHINEASQQRLTEFAARFDQDSVAHKVIMGEENIAYLDPQVRDLVTQGIVNEITKFDFAKPQNYHDIADDLARSITGPMLYLAPKWQEDEDAHWHLQMVQASLDFLSSHSDKEGQLAQLNHSLDGIINCINKNTADSEKVSP